MSLLTYVHTLLYGIRNAVFYPFEFFRFCAVYMHVTYSVFYRHYLAQKDNPAVKWTLPEEFSVVYTNIQGELTVSGVFLRLFIANPGWVLRRPKEFITELLEKWSQLSSSSNTNVCVTIKCNYNTLWYHSEKNIYIYIYIYIYI